MNPDEICGLILSLIVLTAGTFGVIHEIKQMKGK